MCWEVNCVDWCLVNGEWRSSRIRYHALCMLRPEWPAAEFSLAQNTVGMPMRFLEAALMPRRCVFCGVLACAGERYICQACYRDLPWIANSCEFCATPVSVVLPRDVPCASCQFETRLLTSAVAPLHYSFPLDSAIKALKFHRKLYYQPAFSDILLSAAARLPDDIDALLPVPLHRWRRIRRGFNQAEEIAGPLLSRTQLPEVRNVERVMSTRYQSGLSAAERRRNLKAAFCVRGSVAAKHVLIVDDVITTGETCRQLAYVLLKNGVEKVSVLALARAARDLEQRAPARD